ncbi:hypothetical protein V6Z11_A05G363200 [Gossypium hirsutum]
MGGAVDRQGSLLAGCIGRQRVEDERIPKFSHFF